MNKKQFLLVLAALAVIGLAGLLLWNRSKESWVSHAANMGDKLLPGFEFNRVAAIHIKGSSEINLSRKDGIWRVGERGDYPANFAQVSDILFKLRNLKVVQSDDMGPSQLVYMGLAEPGSTTGGGTLVEFKNEQGAVVNTLLLGKKYSRHKDDSTGLGFRGVSDGRYVLLPKDPSNVLLISDELASLNPEPETWLSREFFKPEKVKTIALATPNPTNSWELSRQTETSPWSLANVQPSEVLDTNFAFQVADALEFPRFNDVLADTKTQPRFFVMTIKTFDQFSYTLKIDPYVKGSYRMTVAVTANLPEASPLTNEVPKPASQLRDKLAREQKLGPWVYVVDSWIDPMLRNRSDLLVKKTILSERSANDAVLSTTQ